MILRRPSRRALQREWRAQTRLMGGFERRLRRDVQSELTRVGQEASRGIEQAGQSASVDWLLREHPANLQDILRRHYQGVMEAFGGRILEAGKSFGLRETKDAQSFLLMQIFRYIDSVGGERIRRIAETTRAQIVGAIQGGLDEGLGQAEIARRVRDKTAGAIGRVRAEIIARTEVHNASQAAQADALEIMDDELGFEDDLKREWVAVEDLRTRPEHMSADGQVVDLEGTFDVGGVPMRFPGDPTAPARLTINCRCVAAAVVSD